MGEYGLYSFIKAFAIENFNPKCYAIASIYSNVTPDSRSITCDASFQIPMFSKFKSSFSNLHSFQLRLLFCLQPPRDLRSEY